MAYYNLLGFWKSSGVTPTFELLRSDQLSGVDNLSASLTINSVSENPALRYKGGDADGTDWDSWTYGNNLDLETGTAPSYNQGSPLLGANDDSVLFNGGGYYQDSGTTLGNVGTNDFVFEIVFKSTDTTSIICAKRDGGVGYEMGIDSSNRLYLRVEDSDSNSTVVSGTLDLNTWYHAMIFVDRSGSMEIHLNGVTSGSAVSCSGDSGTLDSSTSFTVGDDSGGDNNEFDSNIAYLAMWDRSAWLDTHEQDAVSKERFEKMSGFWASGSGTTLGTTIRDRPSVAYLDKIESGVRYLYRVGDDWMRFVHREDSASTTIKGYLAEMSESNICKQSEDFSTTWTQVDGGDTITTNATTAPNKEVTADDLIADATDGDHGVSQAITTSATTYSFSVWAKAGNKDWLYLSDDTVANAYCYFNISTGALGTAGASATGYIEDWGGGWCRCGIKITATAASNTFSIKSANADTDKDFAGNGSTVNTSIWGAQLETFAYPSSYIRTTTASVTRSTDDVRFKGDDGNITNNQTGAMLFDILLPDYNSTQYPGFLAISDGGSASDRISAEGNSFNDLPEAESRASVGNNGTCTGSSDVFDGVVKNYKITWEVDSLKLYIDGSQEGSTDTDCGMPDDIDRIDIGQSYGDYWQMYGVISNIRIYDTIEGE